MANNFSLQDKLPSMTRTLTGAMLSLTLMSSVSAAVPTVRPGAGDSLSGYTGNPMQYEEAVHEANQACLRDHGDEWKGKLTVFKTGKDALDHWVTINYYCIRY